MPDDAQNWLDKTGTGVIGTFTLKDGEKLTAEIVGFDEDSNGLITQPIASPKFARRRLAINSVRTFEPEQASSRGWPHSDPCRSMSFSPARFALMTCILLLATFGSLLLFVLYRSNEPYRLQKITAFAYTTAVIYGTFAAMKGAQPYMFRCPAVTPTLARLLWRHIGFLVILFAMQTGAFALEATLPPWWTVTDAKGGTVFELTLLLLCYALGILEVFLNRSVLKRAHSEFQSS